MPTYQGSCHCGAVRYEVSGELVDLDVCNCSICVRSAYVHWAVDPECFRLLTPRSAIATYEFGTRTAKHHFCRTCGISAFRISRSEPEKITVNARCLDGVDPDALPVSRFDGRNWEEEMARRTSRS
jgi:hypothetical protein